MQNAIVFDKKVRFFTDFFAARPNLPLFAAISLAKTPFSSQILSNSLFFAKSHLFNAFGIFAKQIYRKKKRIYTALRGQKRI